MDPSYPRAINHIAIGVADLEAAMVWYQDVFGFGIVDGPVELSRDDDPRGQLRDVLGPSFNRVRIGHLVTGNGVGIELFQSIDPPHLRRDGTIEFWRSGVGHLCVTDPDIEALTAKIVATGGLQLSKIWNDRPPLENFRMAYCQDPFGTLIEIYTLGYERFRVGGR